MNSIEILRVLPKISRYGFKIEKRILKEKTLVRYKTQGRTVKHTFPKKLILNEKFFIGCGLSIGDGLNNPSIRNTHYNFSNSNFKLVYIVYGWLKKYFDIKALSFQFILFQKNKNSQSIDTIKRLFHIEEARIKTYQSNRHRKDVLTIQISNPIFQLVYLRLFELLMRTIINNNENRRSFLKGLFAAEGHVKHSVYKTIESISFAFNPKNEGELAEVILQCLKMEGVCSKISKDSVYFCGYENMIKFYLTGILSLHDHKRNKFLRLINHKNYTLYFSKNSLKFLRNISQSGLAEKIGCSQPGICMMLKRKGISIKNLEKLESARLINKRELLYKINFVRVANSKIENKDCIEFLKNKIF